MASSSSKLATAMSFILLYVCVCIPLAISQGLSVCGPGPHVLNQTGLDVYLLPGTSVTLQPVRYTDRPRGIKWIVTKSKAKLNRSRIAKEGDNLKIGPIDQSMNLVRVIYQQGKSTPPPSVRGAAVLHLAESEVTIAEDQGYKFGQLVQVTTGSTQRVICYKRTSHKGDTDSFPTPLDYQLTNEIDGSQTSYREVPRYRYDIRDSCLWMNSLQQRDSGKYSLEMKTCVSPIYTSSVDFSISFIQSAAATNMRPAKTTSSKPKILQLTLRYGGGHMKSGILTISVPINATLNISYNVAGRNTPNVSVVRLDGVKADRVTVKKKKKIRLEKVQESDSGLYEVIAIDGDERVTKQFTLIVQNENFITSSYPTIPTDTSGPNLKSNITGARNATYSVTRYPTRTMTIPTNVTSLHTSTSLYENGTRAAVADGPQGWVFGIIVLFILLAITIPTVYLSYRRRDSLRLFCSTRCHSFKRESQQSNPEYWNATYATVVRSTVSPNSERGEITTSTFQVTDDTAANHPPTYSNVQGVAAVGTSNELPDIIAAVTTQTNATDITIGENNEMFTVDLADATNEAHGTGPMPIYAIVHKKKKPARDTSHTFKVEETKSPQTSATFAKEEFRSAEFLPLYAMVNLKEKNTKRNHDHDLSNNVNVKERTSTKRPTNDGGETTQRPAPYKGSSSNYQSQTEEESNTNPAKKAAGNDKADDDPHSIVYAELSTPTPNGERKSSDAFTAKPPTHTIQYVDLDIAALTKK